MELTCRVCGERAERGRPKYSTPPLTPPDRLNYRHKGDGQPLCPEVGVTKDGKSGYIPCLPIPG